MQMRDYLPKTLFGRMLAIILLPMILVQVITVFIFYERHWDTVTRHMAQNLASEIALVIHDLGSAPSMATIDDVTKTGWHYFNSPSILRVAPPYRPKREKLVTAMRKQY